MSSSTLPSPVDSEPAPSYLHPLKIDSVPQPVPVSLRQIAAWDLVELDAPCTIKASVPALQRGLVWSPQQVELLWDSLLRGFPVGSFVVGSKIQAQERGDGKGVTHHLLDGQQRANAITLGFDDPFAAGTSEMRRNRSQSILWLDLDPTRESEETEYQFPASSTREFLVRVTTLAHPWGYRPDDVASRLSASQAREAVASECDGLTKPTHRPAPIDLFPWHANFPLPLGWLTRAIGDGDVEAETFWQEIRKKLEHEKQAGRRWPTAALTILNEGTEKLNPIYHALQRAMRSRLIILEAPSTILEPTRAEAESGTHNGTIASIEHLFNRLNSQGTPLSGEELAYSMIKAYWPEVADVIDSVSRRRIPSSHLAVVGVRAALTPTEDGKLAPPIGIPRLRAIASAANGSSGTDTKHRTRIKEFLGIGGSGQAEGNRLARACAQVDDWLVYDPSQSPNGLPPVLVSSFARSNADSYLFLMHLADRLRDDKRAREDREWKEVLPGLATLVRWFSEEQQKVANLLMEAVQKEISPSALRKAIRIAIEKKWIVAPHSPDDLSQFISFPTGAAALEKWSWEGSLIDCGTKEEKEKRREEWWPFLLRVLWQNGLLIYGQRKFLYDRFPDYDPSRKDLWEAHNRPWDFDHLHASAFFYNAKSGSYAHVCREIGYTIGNQRAWPFEANRSDQDDLAKDKLGGTPQALQESLIESVSELTAFSHGKNARKDHAAALALCKATSARLVRIYRLWYESANIAEFLPEPSQKVSAM